MRNEKKKENEALKEGGKRNENKDKDKVRVILYWCSRLSEEKETSSWNKANCAGICGLHKQRIERQRTKMVDRTDNAQSRTLVRVLDLYLSGTIENLTFILPLVPLQQNKELATQTRTQPFAR